MELVQYLHLLRKWAWLLILGLLLGVVAGYVGSMFQRPVYSSATKLIVGGALQAGNQTDYLASYNAQQLALTYVQLVTTQPFIDSVSERLNVPLTSGNISAQLLPNTQIIQIRAESLDPASARDIANMLVTVLVERNEELQAGRFTKNETNLQSQIEQVQKQISTLQGDIGKISQQNVQDQIDQVKAQITPLQDEATRLEQDVAVLDAQNASFLYPSAEAKAKIAENKAIIIEKNNRIDQIKPLLAQYQQVYSNLVILGQAGNSQNNTQLTQLQSTLNVYQQLYINLLSSLETVRLSRMQNTPTVTQIEPANLPGAPIRPKPLTNAATAAVIGLLIACAVIFLIEYMDDTVKSPEQLERILGLSVVGYIADVPKGKTEERGLYVSVQPRSPVAEAFRSLRTNLEFSGVDHPLQTILITSSGPGEGKTTISSNLAAIIAQSGKHVALVDADMRRPSVHRFFDIPNRTGLTDVFRGRLEIGAVTHSWNGTGKISVVTTGSLPPNPTEMLGSEKMTRIIDELKSQNDLVIIDSPPAIVADAQVLAAKVDGVVIVIWPGHSHMDGVRATIDQLNRAGANILGFVFNRIPQSRSSYFGGYKHYSQYYYRNYEYHSEDTPEATVGEKG